MKTIQNLTNWNFKINSLSFEKAVTLPHTWNVEENKDVQLYREEALYETTVSLPALGEKKAVLYFGCAYHTANIMVNRQLAGLHTGSGNTPFTIDITECLQPGENLIQVYVNNKNKEEMLPHCLDYDWSDDGGLTRNVLLITGSAMDLWHAEVTYDLDTISNNLGTGSLHLGLHTVPQKITLEMIDCNTGDKVISYSTANATNLSLPFENLKLWSPDTPNLYELHIIGEEETITKRIGFRQIEVVGPKLYLNKQPLYLKGCEWMPGSHPDYGMAEPLSHSIKCLSQLKDAGCNFTRFHWQQDTTLYDWCDEHGLLVQEEIPYWGYPKEATPLQLSIAREQAKEMIFYHGHHPSIVCWGVGNELGGEFPTTIDYVKKMVSFFKTLDSSRLVNYVSNSVCRDTNVNLDDATLYGDIAMWNDYLGLWQPCEDIPGVIRRTYEKFGNMPSLVSEFGLCEPAFSGGDEKRCEILLERIPLYRELENMVGYVWFSLNDYRTHCGEFGEGRLKQRIHGSTDLYAKEKPSYQVLQKIQKQE